MSKKRKDKGSFGSSIEEVNANISAMEKERIALAKKVNAGKASNKENKRFGELDNELTEANKFRTTFQTPISDIQKPTTTTVDKNVVIGTPPEGKNPDGSVALDKTGKPKNTTNTPIDPRTTNGGRFDYKTNGYPEGTQGTGKFEADGKERLLYLPEYDDPEVKKRRQEKLESLGVNVGPNTGGGATTPTNVDPGDQGLSVEDKENLTSTAPAQNAITPDGSVAPVNGGTNTSLGGGDDIAPMASPQIPSMSQPQSSLQLGTPGDALGLGGPGIPAEQTMDPNQQIVQQTIAGIQRPEAGAGGGVGQAIDQSTFGGGASGLPPLAPKTDPLIQMDRTLSMGMMDPINKGSSTGQLTGTRPIFVGGGDFTPFHIMNNRKKAIQDAANQKAAEDQALLNQKPPILKDQRFQGNMNKQFFNSMDSSVAKAKEAYGDRWGDALRDQSNPLGREFVQNMANFDFIAGTTDQVTDKIAAIDEDMASGEAIYSDETLQLRDDYLSLQNEFLNGNLEGAINLADEFEKLKGFASIDEIINDENIDVKGTVEQYANVADNDENYITSTQKETRYEEQLGVLADELSKFQFRDAIRSGLMTRDDVFNSLNARYGYETIRDKKVTTKPGGSGSSITVNLDSGEEGEQKQKIGDTIWNADKSFAISSKVKAFDMSGNFYYDKSGKKIPLEGINNVKLNKIQAVEIPNEDGTTSWKPVALVDVESEEPIMQFGMDTGKTKTVSTARMVDLESPGIQAQIKTDAVDNFDEIYNEVKTFADGKNKGTAISGRTLVTE
jgi:hypothetical protein